MREAQAEEATARRPVVGRGDLLALRQRRYWVRLAAVAGAYIVAAKFGINLSVAHGVVTPVWAPSGISLGALLIFGPRLWPAVALGALVANATSDAEPLVAAAIAVGNTLEAVVGAFLLRRVGFRITLQRIRDVLARVEEGRNRDWALTCGPLCRPPWRPRLGRGQQFRRHLDSTSAAALCSRGIA